MALAITKVICLTVIVLAVLFVILVFFAARPKRGRQADALRGAGTDTKRRR